MTETYPPDVNGVAMSVARVAEGLHASGHGIQLVRPRHAAYDAPAEQKRFSEVLSAGWPIPVYPGLRMGVPCTLRLQRLWAGCRPDLVHVATEGLLGWSAVAAARRLRIPVTSDFRTNFHAYARHYGAGWLAAPLVAGLRHFHNRTQCTMVPTAALCADLAARGFQRLVVVGRGVDTTLFAPRRRSTALRRQWGAGESDLVLLCVGRLAREKNLLLAVRTFQSLRARSPDVRLLFVGDGPLRPELQVRCPQALFVGARHGEDLAAHYASADILLFPSLTETYGNVTAEGMASALPVLAFDCAAAQQLIDSGRDGALAPVGDEVGFIATAHALAVNPMLRAKLGAAARRKALAYGWQDVIARFEAALFDAIETMPRHLAAEPVTADVTRSL